MASGTGSEGIGPLERLLIHPKIDLTSDVGKLGLGQLVRQIVYGELALERMRAQGSVDPQYFVIEKRLTEYYDALEVREGYYNDKGPMQIG